MELGENSTRKYIEQMRGKSAKMTGKLVKGRLLGDFSEVTEWER